MSANSSRWETPNSTTTSQPSPDDAFREQAMAHGAPGPITDLMVSIFAAARNGEFTSVDSTLAELIGREPATFRTLLERSWAE
jgi:hypothetical protein